jgi:phospholipase/lecithinase/hemolysin
MSLISVHKVCILFDPCFSNAQKNPLLVEGGWRERDEAAVSAGEARRLHCANHLHPGTAASHSAGKMRREPAARHWQQTVLHQLVGHVLAH